MQGDRTEVCITVTFGWSMWVVVCIIILLYIWRTYMVDKELQMKVWLIS